MRTLIFILLTISAFYSQAQVLPAHDVAVVFYNASCDQTCLPNIYSESFQSKQLRQLPRPLFHKLQMLAYEQAQIWGDTILEGDYVADGNTKIDRITVIKRGNQIIGYAITYSERAWFVGECRYVHNQPDTLTGCKEGRIYETSFASADLSEAKVDENQFAVFKAND